MKPLNLFYKAPEEEFLIESPDCFSCSLKWMDEPLNFLGIMVYDLPSQRLFFSPDKLENKQFNKDMLFSLAGESKVVGFKRNKNDSCKNTMILFPSDWLKYFIKEYSLKPESDEEFRRLLMGNIELIEKIEQEVKNKDFNNLQAEYWLQSILWSGQYAATIEMCSRLLSLFSECSKQEPLDPEDIIHCQLLQSLKEKAEGKINGQKKDRNS